MGPYFRTFLYCKGRLYAYCSLLKGAFGYFRSYLYFVEKASFQSPPKLKVDRFLECFLTLRTPLFLVRKSFIPKDGLGLPLELPYSRSSVILPETTEKARWVIILIVWQTSGGCRI